MSVAIDQSSAAVGACVVLYLSLCLCYRGDLGLWNAVWPNRPTLCNLSCRVCHMTNTLPREHYFLLPCSIIALSLFMVPLQSSFAKPQTPTDVGKQDGFQNNTSIPLAWMLLFFHCRPSSAQGSGVVVLCP